MNYDNRSIMIVMKTKHKILFLTGCFATIFFYSVYYHIDSIYWRSVEYKWPMGKHGVRYILYWDSMWQYEDFGLGYGNEIFKTCPVSNCYTTKNRELIPIEDFDAMIFHGAQHTEIPRRGPPSRNPNQVYIYYTLESPFTTPMYFKSPYGYFNWTMTYRYDSDVLRQYGRVVQKPIDYKLPTIEDIKKKSKKIAWFVSHCGVESQREMLAKKISKHMKVDIYGKCGQLKCPRDKFSECYLMLESNYKFYLSFENSVCKDYVTEKLFNILKLNVIPVVYGDADYDSIAPPHSVIDVRKYKTVKELADYLEFLDKNPIEYLKYFEWKKSYIVDTTPQEPLCQLCKKLNEPRKKTFYEDIIAWLNYPGYCKSGKTLPPIVHN